MADQLLPLALPPGMRNTGTVYQSKGRWYTGNFVRFFQDTIQPIGGWVARELVTVTRSQLGLLAAHSDAPITGVSEAFDVADWTGATNVTVAVAANRLTTTSATTIGAVRYTAIAARETWMVQTVSAASGDAADTGILGPMARIEDAAAPNDYVVAPSTMSTIVQTGPQAVSEVVAGVTSATDSASTTGLLLETYTRTSLVVSASTAVARFFNDSTTRTITLTAGATSGRAGVYHGTVDSTVTMRHSEFYATSGRYLTVDGPSGRNWTAQVLDATGTVLASAAAAAGQALVDMIAVEFPGATRLKVIDTDNGNTVLVDEEPSERLWGGDVWTWAVSGVPMSGVPRAMVSYRLNNDAQVVVIGTTSNLYAIKAATLYDITPAAVTTNNAARIWQLDMFGSYLVAVDLIAPAVAGAAYYWDGDTSAVAVALSPFDGTTPTSALSVVATPERFLTILGGKYTASGWSETGNTSRSRLVTWATQEGGFAGADWVPGASNTAGDFELTTDGALMCGRRNRGGTLLWTTTDLWAMTYIGGPFVYRFDQLGNKCGLIAPNAALVTDTAAYWMGQNGFYVYDGFVRPVPCDVHDYVFGSLNRTYAHYIWAVENPTFGEVTWFYPHASQTEVTRYVTYNYRENHWVTGTLARTTGIALQPGTTVYPVMTNASGTIFNHETASARNSEGTPSLESGPIEIADGDRLMGIQKVIPDDRTVGDVTLTLYTAPNPDTAETTNGPYTLTAQTSVRVKARQVRMKLTEAVATSWRVGVIRLGVVLGSRR